MSKTEKESINLKLILVGDGHTGKTSLINQFVNQIFNTEYIMSIGQDRFIKKMNIDSKELLIQIWDTAGQEQYSNVNKIFIKKSNICILVYDITSEKSFKNLPKWYNDVLSVNQKENLVFGVAANKSDLYENEEVNVEEGKKYAESIGAFFSETSALNYNTVKVLFEKVVEEYYNKFLKETINNKNTNNNNNNNANNNESKTIIIGQEKNLNQNTKKKCCEGKKKFSSPDKKNQNKEEKNLMNDDNKNNDNKNEDVNNNGK